MSGWTQREIEVDGCAVIWFEAGAGKPLLVLHDELGPAPWQGWCEDLAQHRRLIMPVAPGFRSPRLAWIRSVTDLSRFYGRMLRAQGLGPVDAVGFSFGGWLAAEMAVNDPAQFTRLALIAPFGIKPAEGYIADMYIVTTAEYLRSSVADPETTPEFAALYRNVAPEVIESWEDARIETAQLGWEPYMHNPSLGEHVRGLSGLPTLVIWGDRDAILPASGARAYTDAIPGARLEIIAGAGHRPELERRAEFIDSLNAFID